MGKRQRRSDGGGKAAPSAGPRGVERAEGRIRSFATWDDALAGDDVNGEDAFGHNLDKVTLDVDDGSVALSGRRAGRAAAREADDAALGIGDEVYALDLPEPSASSDDEDEPVEAAAPARKRKRLDRSGDDAPAAPSLPLSRFSRPDPTVQDRLLDSDDDDDAEREDGADEGDAPADKWNKRAYHVNAGEDPEPESDDEEAVELQLAEVQRLQRERRAKLTEADFAPFPPKNGLGLPASTAAGKTIRMDAKRLFEADDAAISRPSFASRAHAIAHLLRHEPEVLALVDDFVQLAEDHEASAAHLQIADSADDEREQAGQALEWLYHDTLTTYLTTLTFYFHLRLSPQPTVALQHTVLSRVLQLRNGLSILEDEGFGPESSDPLDGPPRPSKSSGARAPASLDLSALGDEELEGLVAELKAARAEGRDEQEAMQRLYAALDAGGDGESESDERSSDEDEDEESDEQSDDAELAISPPTPPTAIGRKALATSAPSPSRPALPPRRARAARRDETADDDLLDPTSLTSADASDKAAAKHSLRFHTARIDAKASKRAAAAGAGRSRAGGGGGDDDVPYRSKERSRAAVVKERQSTANRARNAATARDGADWGMDDVEGDGDAGLGAEAQAYFDLVKRNKADAKAAKQAAHQAERAADRDALAALHGDGDEGGPRAANRTILNNRGLTPKRQKLNRNPRVKKRVRYETAKSKVKSQRPVFNAAKAHAGRSGTYEGEATGISKRTVKSRRLG